ncbi:MAG TPA: LLM class flavin-dependent oxidoreductase [Solirubrobacteraceae bacterium]|nr:LLM class flavin-dependent oxidoreductase [Solirubrobacteraceae bacterium]
MAIELGILQNGYSDLPSHTNADGIHLPQGTMRDSLGMMQRVVNRQIKQGVLADQLGFDYFFLTEHHFQPEGAEQSPNPLMIQAALAVLTKQIRLGQMANILPWHHPVRLAEQAAIVDILSNGRLEMGIGRGYQQRESEVLARPYGAGLQDGEKYRRLFEEGFELLKKSFTEESFSHQGEFFQVPPPGTNWHHPQTIAYYQQEQIRQTVEQVMDIGVPTDQSGVASMTTTLKQITVGPQPLQSPTPQFWMPMTTRRSAEWAASNGVNGLYAATPNELLNRELDIYHNAAKASGWSDRLDRGEFARGWDSGRKRGVAAVRTVHVVDGDVGNEALYMSGLDRYMDYMLTFGSLGVQLAEAGYEEASSKTVAEAGLNMIGSPDKVLEGIEAMKVAGGFDDMCVVFVFDGHALPEQMVEDQMSYFAENIMPVLHKEYGKRDQEALLYPPPEAEPAKL